MREDRLEWVQPLDRWGGIFYHHSNSVSVNAHFFPVEKDSLVLFPPGCHATHARVDDNTYHHFLGFNLPGQGEDMSAIPLVNHGVSRIEHDLVRAANRIAADKRPTQAFVWNLLWALAKNPVFASQNPELVRAEDFIATNLANRILIDNIAEHSGLSARQLLRLFRNEHGMTIQEYIRKRRIEEATRMLSQASPSIKVVASRIGMPDLQAFNKFVRAETGLSPKSYRQKSAMDKEHL